MNKLKVFCSFLVLGPMMCATNGFAADGFDVGTEVYYYQYKEPGFMENKGVFYGIDASYTKHFDPEDLFGPLSGIGSDEERAVVRLDGRFAGGQVDYTSESTGATDNIGDYVFEARLTGGYDFDMSGQSVMTPYAGVGYRYLNDDSSGKTTTTGAFGYEREANYLYIPIGADYNVPVNNVWRVKLNAEFDLFIFGKQKSHLGDAISGLNTVNSDQEEGMGGRASVRFTREGENTVFFIEPFIRYWHVDDSEVSAITYNGVLVGYGLEPENRTIEAGAKIGIKF